LVGETVQPIPATPGQLERFDCEYVRNGTANLFMVSEPLLGWRAVKVTARRTAKDFAEVVRWLAEEVHPEAETIVLVMDNLNTHKVASLYEAFPPERARGIAERLEIHHTPKHGSWLNVAEIELSVLSRQCLDRRIESMGALQEEVAAWEEPRNEKQIEVRWQFTTDDARVKLRRLYPVLQYSRSTRPATRNNDASYYSHNGCGKAIFGEFVANLLPGMTYVNHPRCRSRSPWLNRSAMSAGGLAKFTRSEDDRRTST